MPETIQSQEELLAPFVESETPRGNWVIGTEAEKFGVYADGSPVLYEGDAGIRYVLEQLRDRHGWVERPETEGGPLIALTRGRASITLEPGAQLELSGSPLDTIHQTHCEFAGHAAEIRGIGQELGIEWLGLGYHPFARQEDLDWVPKLRYTVMRDYLLTRGSRARDMMRRTCTVQANLDYENEADAMRKLRLALRATPIVTALFANSPWSEGKRSTIRSHRAAVWQDVDPDRSGMLPFAWREDAGYQEYVDWALDAPMFLFKRNGKIVHNTGQTFRAFLRDGFEGHRATHKDWDTHLNTMFPEVRLKRTLELRSADGQSLERVCALPAVWKGLLYEEQAMASAETLLAEIEYEHAVAAQRDLAVETLDAAYAERPLRDWAVDLLKIAKQGLERLGHIDGEGRDESIHLQPLLALNGLSPAEHLLEAEPADSVQGMIAASRF